MPPSAGRPARAHFTRPYQTFLDQILSSRTSEPVFGECQIFPLPA